jgi:hypothetical protein
MRHLSDFQSFLNEAAPGSGIHLFRTTGEVTTGEDGRVDVKGAVSVNSLFKLQFKELKKIPVEFGRVASDFFIRATNSLETLEGFPQSCGNWSLTNNRGLRDLTGAPSEVRYNVTLELLRDLQSLKGGPSVVKGNYSVASCASLASLEGAPSEVPGSFTVRHCTKLSSLQGSPKRVAFLGLEGCTSLTTLQGGPVVTSGSVSGLNNSKFKTRVPQEEIDMLKDPDLFNAWMASGLSLAEFKRDKRGLVAKRKFGM